jgi:hypothetical protein
MVIEWDLDRIRDYMNLFLAGNLRRVIRKSESVINL